MQRSSSFSQPSSSGFSPYSFTSSAAAAAAASPPELIVPSDPSAVSTTAVELTEEQKSLKDTRQDEHKGETGLLSGGASEVAPESILAQRVAAHIPDAEIDESMSESQKKIITTFNAIRSLAIDGREQQLSALLNDEVCVDMRYGDTSAVYLLAQEGQHAAVDLLINRFGASMHEAVCGYAHGGYVEAVKLLLKDGALPLEAIRGYAKAGNFKACNELCDQTLEKSRILHPIDCHMAALTGFAYFNSPDLVSERLEIIKNLCGNEKRIFNTYNILGHVIDWCSDEDQHCIVSNRDPATLQFAIILIAIYGAIGNDDFEPMHPEDRLFAGYGLAIRGDFNKIKEWKTGISSEKNYLDGVAQGLAFSGRYDKTVLTLPHVDREQVLYAYACGGHVQQVNELIASGCKPQKAILGYARFGHIKACENLLEKSGAQYFLLFGKIGIQLHIAGYLDLPHI